METYIYVVAGFGALVLLTAWLPMVLRALPLSLPICCVGVGAALSVVPALSELAPHPGEHLKLVEHATEAVVVISLMGAGLKIDRLIGWKRWATTWRLLGLAMPLTIITLAALASALLGLGIASALLLAASLAPTDPVLASDVQVGHPSEGKEDEMRFALTSEAGLNDGLAFPFVNLAIALTGGGVGGLSLSHWIAIDILWKVAVGAILGALVGRGLGWLTFHLPNVSKLSRTGDGFVALGVTCLAYGIVQAVDGYGFVGVFAAALALRSSSRGHDYHRKMHDYAEELERLLMMVLLVGFGFALAGGGLLAELTWPAAAFVALALLVVRPLSGWIGLAGSGLPTDEKAVIAFFGIRGLGTAYYLAYAFGHAPFEAPDLLWATVGLAVLVSIVMHGITVTPILRFLDHRSGRDTESGQLEIPLEPRIL
ncbi:sodium:proton antiporter [Methylobacterium sp. WL119]|uniref:cation:proton antiporter n=1 Tax=unclassified Methylobacterium TaxID=2615210 RepID=UPI0011CA4522|nr:MULTISPECIES: cation:proton antiporter [unclassified Methylobacterium]TXN32742.1 sodium:proton antiporter [Methylobacterium sp. WL93]TXN47441.1 sodium:proton antiporter [Methylobacterium sp. WL119]